MGYQAMLHPIFNIDWAVVLRPNSPVYLQNMDMLAALKPAAQYRLELRQLHTNNDFVPHDFAQG